MSDTQKTEYDLKALAEGVFQRPAPESCGEIAELLRFDTPNYFGKTFKRYTGQTPRAYRARLRADGE